MSTAKRIVDTPAPLRPIATAKLPTPFAEFLMTVYQSVEGKEHLALILGDLSGTPPLTRVHSECLTGDALFSLRCDCGFQLEHALQRIATEGRGVVLYLRQEGRGIGLANKLKAYKLQEEGHDTVEANEALGFKADLRDYGLGAQILVDLGVRKMKLMTNNPKKIVGLGSYGLEVVDRVPIEIPSNEMNASYLETKKKKLGHMIGDDPHSVETVLKNLIR